MRNDDHSRVELLLRQWAERAARTGGSCAGRFLTGEEFALARHQARESGVLFAAEGGYPEAERRQACFYAPDAEPAYTWQWVEIRWQQRFGSLSHSDLMGSLMALGIDRMYFGDLICGEGVAWLCTLPETAARLPDEWTQAGRVGISVRVPEEPPVIEPPQGEPLRDTVPSLRLDCVVAAGMRQSRAKAAELIRAGQVQVNHEEELRCDRLLREGQLISVRHFGRIRLKEVGEPTRKDRLPVTLQLFTRG